MGKYDLVGKQDFLKANPGIEYTAQLVVESAATNFPKMAKKGRPASCASETETSNSLTRTRARAVDRPNLRTGRKPVVNPAKVDLICARLAQGESETAGCRLAGIGLTSWHEAKKRNPQIRNQIAAARDQWARLRYQQHQAALYQSQQFRLASRRAKKPTPIRQAQLVAWHLTTRVDLNHVEISEEQIAAACEQFGLAVETWQQQAQTFNLLKTVYEKRSAIRGPQPALQPVTIWNAPSEYSDPNDPFPQW